ncbi:ribosome biogenesis GTP-binding protein YihA/YsxC [Blattabacterium cuenoti]|uniref:ribosome biogenesis GTP-binding protein YihA/YsxC n=1 Tax=Blattabacterium cuenoti TaxID=1653831 RepID=UPI00163B96AC|nr:ribosome biogenesis GTP-binding protein YihA/YsxC [Blattabacterium cuenoti]
MKIYSVEFKGSKVNINQCLFSSFPEYAFAGRSNVGKSSLINFLTNRKKIAIVSSLPGRTKYIHPFLINKKWYLIDLPGYGFTFHHTRKKNLIIDYIYKRNNLLCLFLLIDCRFLLQEIDLYFIRKLQMYKIRFCIVFTKIDKLNKNILNKNINSCKKKIEEEFFLNIEYFQVSVTKKYGRKSILQYIKNILFSYKEKLRIPNS